MLEFLFGWRKASKCKDMLRSVRRRLKPLRSKCDSVIKQQREVMAHLLKTGSSITGTFSRVELLYRDHSVLAAYDLLDQFCGFTIMSLPYIRKHKDILDYPHDIIEAISTLMFTAARLANLPELQVLRKLFAERYGRDFEASAVELYPGNHVNRQMVEKLSASFVSNYDKFNLIKDICREFKLPQVSPNAVRQDTSPSKQMQVYEAFLKNGHRKWDSEVFERDIQVVYYDNIEDRFLEPNAANFAHIVEKNQKMYSDAIVWDASPHPSKSYRRQRGNPCSSQESSEIPSNSSSVNMIRRGMEGTCQVLEKHREAEDYNWILEVPRSQNNQESNKLLGNGRSRSSNGYSSRKRRKSSEPNLKEEVPITELPDRKSRSRRRSPRQSSTASCTNTVETIPFNASAPCRSNNQSASHEMGVSKSAKSSINETDDLPYDILCDKRKSYASGLSGNSYSSRMKKSNHRWIHYIGSYGDENLSPDCCLDQPCYFVAGENDEVGDQVSSNVTLQEMVHVRCHQKPNLTSEGSAESPRRKEHNGESSKLQEEVERQTTNGSGNDQQEKLTPYSRTLSMPAQRAHIMMTRQTLRCASLRRVHPNLPDYDALAAKFTALKREHCKKETVVAAIS